MVASNSKKVIATKCRTACLRAIQRLVDTEQNYTRTFLKLKSDVRDSIIRINNISKNKTNELIANKSKILITTQFLELQKLRDINKEE